MEKNNIYDVVKHLQQIFGNNDIKIPRNIEILMDGNIITLIMPKCILEENMQKDGCAFEGWAFAIYVAYSKKCNIKLQVKDLGSFFNVIEQRGQYLKKGHFCRFLYRAMKFEEQYKWFSLESGLKNVIDDFREYLINHKFTNNTPNDIAGAKEDHNGENYVEIKLAERGVLKNVLGSGVICNEQVYRQLPVGLFQDVVRRENMLFNGGKSAIDLWTWHDKIFSVVELKKCNKMIGIISEIFFYSNYVYDLLKENNGFYKNKNYGSGLKSRGYEDLLEHNFDIVQGIMLADDYHPIIDKKVLGVMNNNGLMKNHIVYYKKEYCDSYQIEGK